MDILLSATTSQWPDYSLHTPAHNSRNEDVSFNTCLSPHRALSTKPHTTCPRVFCRTKVTLYTGIIPPTPDDQSRDLYEMPPNLPEKWQQRCLDKFLIYAALPNSFSTNVSVLREIRYPSSSIAGISRGHPLHKGHNYGGCVPTEQ